MSLILEAWREQGYAPAGGEQLLKDYEEKLQLEANKRDLMNALRAAPAPDSNIQTAPAVADHWTTDAEKNAYRPSKPNGTVNNAGEIPTAGDKNMVRSFAIPTPDASRYTDITVNYTVSGQHGLDEGFVIRYGEIQPDGSVILRTYGEGDNWRQAPPLKFYWGKEVDGVWQENQREILRKIK